MAYHYYSNGFKDNNPILVEMDNAGLGFYLEFQFLKRVVNETFCIIFVLQVFLYSDAFFPHKTI